MPSAGHLIPNQADYCLINDRAPHDCRFGYVPAYPEKCHYILKLHVTIPYPNRILNIPVLTYSDCRILFEWFPFLSVQNPLITARFSEIHTIRLLSDENVGST